MTELMVHSFKSSQIEQRAIDGYFNLSAMCKAEGKLVADYLRLKGTKEYLEGLSTDMGIPISALVEGSKGGNEEQGTWAHPEVAVDCGKWCSIPLRIAVNRWFVQWISHKAEQSEHRRTLELQLEIEKTKVEGMRLQSSRPIKEILPDLKSAISDLLDLDHKDQETVIPVIMGKFNIKRADLNRMIKAVMVETGKLNPPNRVLSACRFAKDCLEYDRTCDEKYNNLQLLEICVRWCQSNGYFAPSETQLVYAMKKIVPKSHKPRRRLRASEDPNRGFVAAHWTHLRIKI